MKKVVVSVITIIVIVCVGIRIYYVNENAVKPVYESYSLGEWIEYDGSYLIESSENTKGYSARVLSATHMTYKEYMEKYNFPLDTLIEQCDGVVNRENLEDIYNLGMFDVQIEFKNESAVDGYISLSETKIFAQKDNIHYGLADTLLELQEPRLAGRMGYFFSLNPNGESIILNVPYILPVYSDGYIGHETNNSPKWLVLTKSPIHKVVEIPL